MIIIDTGLHNRSLTRDTGKLIIFFTGVIKRKDYSNYEEEGYTYSRFKKSVELFYVSTSYEFRTRNKSFFYFKKKARGTHNSVGPSSYSVNGVAYRISGNIGEPVLLAGTRCREIHFVKAKMYCVEDIKGILNDSS